MFSYVSLKDRIPKGHPLRKLRLLVDAVLASMDQEFHRPAIRAHDTHVSTTDSDARLFKKAEGAASRLCHMSHVRMENRNGLVVDVATTLATGQAER